MRTASHPVAIAGALAMFAATKAAMATGWEAVRIAWPAYLVPFLFAASPALLLDAPPFETGLTVVKALVGVYFVTGAIVGFFGTTLGSAQRFLLLVGGATVLIPHTLVDGAIWMNATGAMLVALVWSTRRRLSA